MGFLRCWIRIILIVTFTVTLFVIRLLLYPVALVSEPADRRTRRRIYQFWSRVTGWIMGARYEVTGAPPKGPFFLVSNHLSYFDTIALGRLTGCLFVSRGDLARWPVLGPMARTMYIIFIDRRNRRDTARVNDLIEHAIEQGDGVAVFAEGGISPGLAVQPFKSSLIQPAITNHLPVHHVTLCYETADDAPSANMVLGWWRPEPLFYHIKRLLRCPGFMVKAHFGDGPISGDDRKALAKALHEKVNDAYSPLL